MSISQVTERYLLQFHVLGISSGFETVVYGSKECLQPRPEQIHYHSMVLASVAYVLKFIHLYLHCANDCTRMHPGDSVYRTEYLVRLLNVDVAGVIHPLLPNRQSLSLLPFVTAYLCDCKTVFCTLTNMNTNYISRIVVESDLLL